MQLTALTLNDQLIHRLSQLIYRCLEELGSTKAALYLVAPGPPGVPPDDPFRLAARPSAAAAAGPDDPLMLMAQREKRCFALNHAGEFPRTPGVRPGQAESPLLHRPHLRPRGLDRPAGPAGPAGQRTVPPGAHAGSHHGHLRGGGQGHPHGQPAAHSPGTPSGGGGGGRPGPGGNPHPHPRPAHLPRTAHVLLGNRPPAVPGGARRRRGDVDLRSHGAAPAAGLQPCPAVPGTGAPGAWPRPRPSARTCSSRTCSPHQGRRARAGTARHARSAPCCPSCWKSSSGSRTC